MTACTIVVRESARTVAVRMTIRAIAVRESARFWSVCVTAHTIVVRKFAHTLYSSQDEELLHGWPIRNNSLLQCLKRFIVRVKPTL